MTSAGADKAEDPILPKLGKRELKLDGVMPLLHYLDFELENNKEDRDLTPVEDAKAIAILEALVNKSHRGMLGVEDFCDPQFRDRRTLVQWYRFVHHLATRMSGVPS